MEMFALTGEQAKSTVTFHFIVYLHISIKLMEFFGIIA